LTETDHPQKQTFSDAIFVINLRISFKSKKDFEIIRSLFKLPLFSGDTVGQGTLRSRPWLNRFPAFRQV